MRVLELRSVFGTGGGPEKTILLGTARTDSTAFQITVCYLRSSHDAAYRIDERARDLGVKYVEIKGASHGLTWTRAEEINAELLKFLA